MAGETANETSLATSNKPKKQKKRKSKAPPKLNGDIGHTNGSSLTPNEDDIQDDADGGEDSVPSTPQDLVEVGQVGQIVEDASTSTSDAVKQAADEEQVHSTDTATRLDAAVRERDQLREEVTQLRQSLESIKRRHDADLASTKSELEEAKTGHEQAETRYQKLRGQVNTIKTQLGERLKADAAELSQARERVEELEDEAKASKESNAALQSEVSRFAAQSEAQAREIESLRSRTNLSQQNWAKERDDLLSREAQAREDLESTRQALQDREVLAMEDRSLREGLDERVADLEEQLANTRDAHNRAASERDSQSATVDGLHRALKEMHDARKEERRELVETSQTQIDELRKQLSSVDAQSKSMAKALEETRADLEKAVPFEKEVREKNLLIGKLRHEAVILHDHLTKALRFLKRGKPEDNVDRQLVTNHLLQFLALDRSDPKKFQILQLIAALLGWTDEQKESAGIARPGASTQTSLRVPLSSPFRRVSSSATLSPITNNFSSVSSPATNPASVDSSLSPSKEGLAELWHDFLEREAEEGSQGKGGSMGSRKGSGASTPRLGAVKSPTVGPSAASPSLRSSASTKRLDDVVEGPGGAGGGPSEPF